MRKLVVFNDHSWRRPQYRSKRRPVMGNATLAERCLLGETSNGERQISLLQNDYQAGSGLRRLANRVLGMGFRHEIFEAYEFIANNYMPGDEIYLIGSGRGAFVLQYVAYMISTSGLLHVDNLDQIKNAYIYSKLMGTARRGPAGKNLRQSFQSRDVPIRFLGCWDTVGSHGIPVRGLRQFSILWNEFLSENVSSAVQSAYQALALDETNTAFKPHVWIGVKSKQLRRLEQVWFAGKHENITGGQRDSRLSDIAFRWLLNKATDEGLSFDAQKADDLSTPDPMGQLQEPTLRDKLFGRLEATEQLRAVGRADTHLSRSQIPGTEKLHYSVLEKIKQDSSYAPKAYEVLPPNSLLIALDQDSLHKSNRRHDRHPVNCPATLLVDQSRYNGNVIDFSEGGARVWLHLDMPVGTPVTIRSSVLFDKDYTGHIVWTKDQSVGVAFQKDVDLAQVHFPEGQALQ